MKCILGDQTWTHIFFTKIVLSPKIVDKIIFLPKFCYKLKNVWPEIYWTQILFELNLFQTKTFYSAYILATKYLLEAFCIRNERGDILYDLKLRRAE